MSKHQRSMKNIYKQYGKHIKAMEERVDNYQVPDYIMKVFEKYGLDINSRKPFISIRHWRWDNCVPESKRIDTFAKLEELALSN